MNRVSINNDHTSVLTMEYRYRTIGASGRVSLNDDAVVCETITSSSRWSHETPYRFLEPNPVYTTVLAPSAIWTLLPFVFAILFGLLLSYALRGRVNEPHRILYVSAGAIVVGVAGSVVSKRICMVDWIIFPTTLTGHRVAFTRHGPDVEKYEDFVNALLQRIADSQGRHPIG
jgi:hypothetical protein